MTRTPWLGCSLAVLIVCAGAARASAELSEQDDEPRSWRLSATTGFQADRGVFADTNVNSVPIALRLEHGSWAAGFAASALQVDGPSTVGRVKIGRASADAVERALAKRGVMPDAVVQAENFDGWGYGDSMLTLSHAWYEANGWMPFVEFTAGLKIPTASTRKQHGTGKFDYLLQVDVAKSFGHWTTFATAGYRLNGSSYQAPIQHLTDAAIAAGVDVLLGSTFAEPEPIPIFDTAETSVGFSYYAADVSVGSDDNRAPLHVGLSYDWAQNAVAGVDDTHELIPFVSLEWSRNLQISPYLIIGLSKPAADIGFAAQITVSY